MIKPIISIKNNDDKNFTIVSTESVIMNYDNCDAELNYTANHIDEETSETVPFDFNVLLKIVDNGDYRNSKLLWDTIDDDTPTVQLRMIDVIDRGDPRSTRNPYSWTMITKMKKFLEYEHDAYYIQVKIEANIEGCALVTVYIYKTIEGD